MNDPDTKTCPMCAETVKSAAVRCRFCGYDFAGQRMPGAGATAPQSKLRTVIDAWVDGRRRNKSERKGLSCLGAIGIVVGALLLALYFVWPSDEELDAKRDATFASAPHVLVSPKEFAQAYRQNEVAARTRFEGKAIEMNGKVKSVRNGNMDTIVVVFDAGDGEEVSASVDGDDRAKAGQLASGEIATVQCASILEVLGVRVLARCTLD